MPSGTHLLPRLYAHAAGPLSATYYRDHFERMEAQGRPLVAWNHAAAFNTLGWLCLRRMWLAAGIYAVVIALLLVLWWAVLMPLLGTTAGHLSAAVLLALSVVLPGLWGTQLYYQHLRTRTLQTLQVADTIAQAQQQLGSLAITPQRRNTTAAMQAAVVVVLVGASLSFLPSQPTPTTKATAPSGPPVLHFPNGTPAATPSPSPSASTASPPSTAADALAPTVAAAPLQPVPTPQALNTEPAAQSTTSAAQKAVQEPAQVSAPPAPSVPPAAPSATLRPATPPANIPSKAAVSPPASTALVPGRFYLNAGVFSQTSNADKAEQALRQAGLPVLRSTVQSTKGAVVRLRSGPFETASQARAAQRTAAQRQLEATVFQHRSRS